MSLPSGWSRVLDELVARAISVEDTFFRSVEITYAVPDDVVSGEGTRLNGGRFAPAGTRAVFASLDEETAVREAAARRRRLAGRPSIDLKAYPRMTYLIKAQMTKCVDLRSSAGSQDSDEMLKAALDPDDQEASQHVGKYLPDYLSLCSTIRLPSVEPFLDQPQDAGVSDAMLHELDQPTLVEVVEKSSNVGIQNVVHLLLQERVRQRIQRSDRLAPPSVRLVLDSEITPASGKTERGRRDSPLDSRDEPSEPVVGSTAHSRGTVRSPNLARFSRISTCTTLSISG